MTTPSPPGEFDAGAGRMLGGQSLQESIDKLVSTVNTFNAAVSTLAQDLGNGMTSRPIAASQAGGQRITSGAFPQMGSWADNAAGLDQAAVTARAPVATPAPRRARKASTAAASSGAGTFAGTATQAAYSGGSAVAVQPRGQVAQGQVLSSSYPTYNTYNTRTVGNGSVSGTGTGTGAGQNYSFSGPGVSGGGGPGGGALGAGGGGGPGGGGPGGGGGGSPWGAAAASAGMTLGSMAAAAGGNAQSNMLFYNAYGQQTAAQWGQSAQSAQNSAFGYYNSNVNAAAQGNAQSAAAEMGMMNQMTGGGAIGSGSFLGSTNALSFANQGMGAAGGAQLASQIYNPSSSMMMQMLTGVSAINSKTGQQNSLSSIIGGLSSKGYLGGGSYNATNGTYNQKALNASFTANRGSSYMSLQSLGYSSSQIQDIQSMMSQANQGALKGHTSVSNVMNLMNQAQDGSQSQIESADKTLAKDGISQSTIQKMGNQQSLAMGQQQGESSTYNQSVSDFTTAMTRATQAMNYFLDHTGLGKAVGGGLGASAGYSSSGMSGWVNKGASLVHAALGGGAAAVSTTQQMGAVSKTAGSSVSSVSSQAQTAVRDAEGQVGKPYVYGGDSPATSFDCSGLVMWAYDQAGIRLPRTSEQQWAALKNKSVPTNKVREGDIVFSAGSDGSASAPGHEALMISGNQIVEAPYTGANIRIRAYNPGEWQHAGRPTGNVTSSGAGTAPVSTAGGASTTRLAAGNAGAAVSGGGGDSALALTTNSDSMLFSGGGGGGAASLMTTSANGAGTTPGGLTSTAGNGAGGATGGATSGGRLSASQVEKLWTSLGGPSGAAANMAKIANAESADQPGITQAGQAAGLTGYGLYQITPTSGITQNGKFGNLLNATNNTKAAISLYQQSGFHPWASDSVGAGLTGMATGGPILVGERGPEAFVPNGSGTLLNAAQTSSLLRGTSAQPAQAPWNATPAQQLLLDQHPANNAARGSGGGGGVTVSIGNVTISAPNMTGNQTTSDTQVLGQLLVKQVEDAMSKSKLISNIAQGVTG